VIRVTITINYTQSQNRQQKAGEVQNKKYKAFISYSHKDEKWAARLHKALETYSIPKHLVGQQADHGEIPRRLGPIFRDRDELPSATDLGQKVDAALEQSSALIVICSPEAARSRWVNEEILAFKRLGRSNRIFSLIVGGEPHASDHPDQGPRSVSPRRCALNWTPTVACPRDRPNRSQQMPGPARTAVTTPGSS